MSQPRTILVACASLLERLRRRVRWVIPAIALGCAVSAICLNEASCTPAQQAVYTQIESKVLADLVAGDSIGQIEQDVAVLVGNDIADGGGAAAATIVAIVQDAITFLIDIGVIPPSVLPYAKEVLAAEAMKLAVMKAGASIQSADDVRKEVSR